MTINITSNEPSQFGVAVIGTGQMGSALARAFQDGGLAVTVWNRTQARTLPLRGRGMDVSGTVLEAVRKSAFVVICVMHPTEVTALLGAAEIQAALAGKTVVNYTTSTADEARRLAQWAASADIDYVDGAIMVLPVEIGQPHSMILHAGSKSGYDRHQPALQNLGGKALFVGTDPALSCVLDSSLLTFYYGAVLAAFQAGVLADANGVTFDKLIDYIEAYIPTIVGLLDQAKQMVIDGSYKGSDASLNLHFTNGLLTPFDQARALGISTVLYQALHKVMQAAIDAGRGDEELPVVFDFLKAAGSSV